MSDSVEMPAFLADGGEMGARMRAHPWSASVLGLPEGWSRGLQAAVQIMLNSRFAMWMAWGPELTFFCNDAYLPTTGIKRDWVLGARSDQVWAEIWPDIGPRIRHVLETGRATWDEALLLYLERSGFPEETYHTFSYSPLAGENGTAAGMLCVVAEVTERVIGERQLAMLRDLGSRLAAAPTRADAMSALQTSLNAEPSDLPFVLAYLRDQPASNAAELVAVHALPHDTRATPRSVDLRNGSEPWPLGRVLREGAQTVAVADELLPGFNLKHWQSPPHQAHVVPLVGAEGGAPVGFLVVGLNPHRTFDTDYRGFIDLVAGQLAAAIARADEYERERARAEALAEIDRAKTAFFSNVSHEFRTPLTLMLGPLEDALADPGSLPSHQVDRISIAHRNGLRLLRLVNGLLDFSRIEAGRAEAVFRATDLASYTRELASTFRSACDRAGLEFSVECPQLPEPVYVDADMWEKVVLNLLSNAFKFTLHGSIDITLDAVSDAEVELAVRDTGTGIPAAELPRLFERFHRVEGAKGRSFEGSGIGLALVHDLVSLHGGAILVESEEGRGSTFRVRLPRGTAHLPEARTEGAPSESAAPGRAQAFIDEVMGWLPQARPSADEEFIRDVDKTGRAPPSTEIGSRTGHVLLADDNADLRDYVRRLLEGRGYVVEPVGDGEAALNAARVRRPDLLLTDIMMPGLDGFGLLAAIRADPDLSDLPVVMLSARSGEEAQVEGLGAGADDYLAKPFSARELLARVAANLDMARTRWEAAAAVRASEARLRGVLEGMAEGFALLDPHFRIVEVNAEGLRLESRRRENLVGLTHWEAYPGSESNMLGQLYKKAMSQRVSVSLEHQHTWEDGRISWLDMRAYPTEDGGLAIFYRDVTARRQAEDKLRELNETLENRVREAVAERADALARLNEAQKLETLGQLTGGVAHDFNNLLTPIMGSLELLGKRHSDERSQRLISGGLQSAHRAKTLVQRLLAFARRQTLAPQSVDLPSLFNGLRDLIDRSLGPTIRVEMELQARLPPALVDPNQLELALLNLAVNARDAMEGGGTLTVTAQTDDIAPSGAAFPDGRYVRLDVADTGAGMDEETLARAVEPFFSTKEMGKGTGLGLSMVHGLALQSGGAFRLASVVGVGTTATLWLPIAEGSATNLAEAKFETPRAPGAATLLLVDDEPLVRLSMAELLRELGYEVIAASSAAEALDLIRTGLTPDLLMTDHKMPGTTGAQLAFQLRTKMPKLPILLVTGYAHPVAHEVDGLEVLEKPFAFSDLAVRLANLLRMSRPSP